jgi:hypothetical protein
MGLGGELFVLTEQDEQRLPGSKARSMEHE